MKRKQYIKKITLVLSIIMCITSLTGCDVNDLKRTTHVTLSGDSFANVEKKDERYNEVVENGEIEESDNQQSQQKSLVYKIDGPLGSINFSTPNDWYESTNSKTKKLTAEGNIDKDMKKQYANKVFCSSDGLKKMYVYAIPSIDFGENLVAAATFGKGADKQIRTNMGAYPKTTDIQYGAVNELNYSYQIYSGEVTEKSGLISQVSFSRGACLIGSQTIIVEYYITNGAENYDEAQLINDFFVSIVNNNAL